MIVRTEQFEKIVKASAEDFVNYLAAYVRGNHAEAAEKYDDAALSKMIRGGVRRAAHYRIERVADTEIFIGKMFDVAPNFDEQSAINAVLTDETRPPEKRIELLVSPAVPPEAWDEARRNADEKAWSAKPKKSKPSKE